jgi:hypothetical protein
MLQKKGRQQVSYWCGEKRYGQLEDRCEMPRAEDPKGRQELNNLGGGLATVRT